MKRLPRPLLLLAALAALFGGCQNIGELVVTGLQVELKAVEYHGAGATTADVTVVNPNVVSYLIAGIKAKVYLNDTFIGTLAAKGPLGLPPQGRLDQAMTLVPAGGAAGQIVAEAARSGSARYRLDTILDIQMVGTKHEQGEVTQSGTVAVTGK
ncbi:MAG TPA: hypothetical protein VL200_12600 [Lacunisphaera sp.]|jgi:LEA14-like dessication related protein|nr:hypothetical protein [Lacunisphaera sp.]